MALRKPVKFGLIALVFGGGALGLNYYRTHGSAGTTQVDLKDKGGALSNFGDTNAGSQTVAPGTFALPSNAPAAIAGPQMLVEIIPWNAQMGMLLAIGGTHTMQGSLMAKYGVNVSVKRTDDYGPLQESMVACATELSQGATQCTKGATLITIMGDAAASFMTGLNGTLAKIGPEYTAEIVGSAGRSYGEDKFMGPPAIAGNPKLAAGLYVAGVLKDGDWNIAMHWAKLNGMCNNPNPKVYNPNCLNWLGTNSFMEADEAYISGTCNDLPVVDGAGKKTGDTKHVCVNAVVTWFPGDEAVFTAKGGLVSLMSTRENDSQMANVIIGIRKWNKANAKTLTSFLRATLEGGDQVKRGGGPVLMRAAAASAEVYKEKDAKYWAKYYHGSTEMDSSGNKVTLGGSSVFNLADNLRYYGLDGGFNYYAAAYNTFGAYTVANYPQDLPSFLPVNQVVNLSYLQALASEAGVDKGQADAPNFDAGPAQDATVVAKGSWHITFQPGSATFSPDAVTTLDQLVNSLTLSGNTFVEISGHTDDTGTVDGNVTLSQARAQAVLSYLKSKAPNAFPANRTKVAGFGQSKPVAPNTSVEGRTLNRRVDIVLKSNG